MACDRAWYAPTHDAVSNWSSVEIVVREETWPDLCDWINSDDARGQFIDGVAVYFDQRTLMRFSDPDTAFAFKMRFG